MPQETKSLVRAIGRWSLAALMLNTVIGASIFGLPSLLAAHLGKFSPAGYLVTAVGIAAVAACLAEVASQFREAGGPYLYARASFGRFAAIQIGWLTWLTRIVATAAAADLFVSYLTQFFPSAEASATLTQSGYLMAARNPIGAPSGIDDAVKVECWRPHRGLTQHHVDLPSMMRLVIKQMRTCNVCRL